MLTTHRHPIFYLPINKCACTYLRNLFFLLDHDSIHPDPKRIHAYDREFVNAARVPEDILTSSPFVFTVVRDPVDRFLSLYFDKLANPYNESDFWMRRLMNDEAGFRADNDTTLEQHRAFCLKALGWIDRNLKGKTEAPTNPHWQRQSLILSRITGLDPHLIELKSLDQRLEQLLAPLEPRISVIMKKITDRNESHQLFSKDEMLTNELKAAVHAVYADDAVMIENTRRRTTIESRASS